MTLNKDANKPGILYEDENILPDDYTIYGNYLYVVDGKVTMSDWHDITVKRYKAHEGVKEIRRCNIMARRKAMGLDV